MSKRNKLKNDVMENLELYPFKSAEIFPFFGEIIPNPIYTLQVKGETGSLDAEVKIIDTERIENGYKIFEVVGKDGQAIGNSSYEKEIGVYPPHGTVGVIVIGKNHTIEIPFSEVIKK
jgi:hypothetical protein